MSSGTPLVVATLADFGGTTEQLFPAVDVPLPCSLRHSNVRSVDSISGRGEAFNARIGQPQALTLHRLPSDAVLHGTAQYAVTRPGVLLSEQSRALYHGDPSLLAGRLSAPPAEIVPGDVLLIARYGERTWGHWLGEMLPKVALAEHLFPGRFTYAVANAAFTGRGSGVFGQRATESLAAYGVTRSRLMLVREDRGYRFESLHAISPVWSSYMMHPAAREILRALVTVVGPNRRVALLRGDNSRRGLTTLPELMPILTAADFVCFDIGLLPFLDQVAVMRGARAVFSILGSSLSGLIYAPQGVAVISAAPEGFSDRFFYSMIQQADGTYAELSGPIVERDDRHIRDSSFCLPPPVLAEGLGALGLNNGPKPGIRLTLTGLCTVGDRQLQGVAERLAGDFTQRHNRLEIVRCGRPLPLQHSTLARLAAEGVPDAARSAVRALGYTDEDVGGFFGPVPQWSDGLWIGCFWHEAARVLYRHQETGLLIPVAFPRPVMKRMIATLGHEAGADARNWPVSDAVPAGLLNLLRDEFDYVGQTPRRDLIANIRLILSSLPTAMRRFVLMAPEFVAGRDGERKPATQAQRINGIIRHAIANMPAVHEINVADCAPGPMREAFTLTPALQEGVANSILARLGEG